MTKEYIKAKNIEFDGDYPKAGNASVNTKFGKLIVNIFYDEFPTNPFEDWDYEPPLVSKIDRNHITIYSEYGNPVDALKLTNKQILDNLNDIVALFGYDNLDEFFDDNYDYEEQYSGSICDIDSQTFNEFQFDDECDFIREYIAEQDFSVDEWEAWETLLTVAGVPCLNTTVTGYTQSSWADLFIWLPDEWYEKIGAEKKDAETALKATANLYKWWAFGDVYGYTIEDEDGEQIDSCWGFYGPDMDKNGLLDAVNNALECWENDNEKKRTQRVESKMKPYKVLTPETNRKMTVKEARRLNRTHTDSYGNMFYPGYVFESEREGLLLDIPPDGYEWRYIGYGWGLHLQKCNTDIFGKKLKK